MKTIKKTKLFFWINYIKIIKKLKSNFGYSVFYIGGSETLPPPLSSEEENYLLKKLCNNDIEVKSILIERNLRLVVYIARKFENTGITWPA